MIPKISKRWPKRSVETFFDTWSPDMAYILGYFASDGCMYQNKRGSHYISFTSTDIEIIQLIKKILGVTNEIETYKSKFVNWKLRYTIQIGSKSIFKRFEQLGFTPNKSLTLSFPNIPDALLGHFIRGYFDGDGCATFRYYKRKNRPNPTRILSIRFRCGSQIFIGKLRKELKKSLNISGYLYFHSNAYELVYSTKDVLKLFRFMYPERDVPHLGRKRTILQKGLNGLGP
ncbi:hypothetical protein A3J13_00335 [Candidatus Daviesbacteria bacterium RIFCSPLOWO2_02_FULL_36_8]|uniref:DOD-type homing endonuclease domain-containing protein n=1 Tax=Candidatus Daviesbacteria bacterium RIFCSPLOWO2_02_FULL_36_8 TaxID=1797793 RepID=A0A1F5MGD1_9BACT|nr:MAG: hypothetical protein A3J13_00335 [Candidatus Daviesbacteria bacterium RIFCSPLOWO2_02_FULL_36_8]